MARDVEKEHIVQMGVVTALHDLQAMLAQRAMFYDMA